MEEITLAVISSILSFFQLLVAIVTYQRTQIVTRQIDTLSSRHHGTQESK